MPRPFEIGPSKVIRETEKALLVRLHDSDDLWIPKSVIHDNSEVFDDDQNSEGNLVIHEWWAEKNGLL